ncbi:hypothetical protein P7K49_015737 [Saguinus oedipus]|uniref:Uncharacterized protein n=1 Tax=Saguinus oedipus TaxID=9490 RepID=A0ABQ9VC40_SAGOE|nr:hypothetical protein P7K49_015737 [Saguinus oedipus]
MTLPSPQSCPVSNRLLHDLRVNGASLEVTLAFSLIRFSTSDTLYLHGRVTLGDTRARRQCQPVSEQSQGLLRSRRSLACKPVPAGQAGPRLARLATLVLASPTDLESEELAWEELLPNAAGPGARKQLDSIWAHPNKRSLDGHLSSDGDRLDAEIEA